MKFLIAGLGSIGRRHFRNLVALGEKDIVLYRTHQATLPEAELQGYPVETDLAAALRRHKPQAVIVANPTALHLQVAVPAAEAGCALLLEKPVSNDLRDVDVLRTAAQKNGGKILVGFQFRFHPALQKAAALIQSGALGRLLTVHAHWGEYLPDWHAWEDYRKGYAARADLGGGVIVTLTHPLDYLRWLMGDVASLWSFNAHVSPLEVDVEDVAEIGLRFANGAIGGVHLNYVQRPPVHRLEIAGTQGTLRWDGADGVLHFQGAREKFGASSPQPLPPVIDDYALPADFERNVMFLDLLKHFMAVARGEVEPVCSLEDGIRALELALAAYQSQANGKVVTWG